jgi:phage tail sheath protein FI
VQSALIQQCEDLRDRIALLDPPFAAARNDKLGVGAVRAWRSRFDSKYAAFYYPWLRVVDPLRITSITRDIPPSGHVAGQYAQTDFRFGVHKAPANGPLSWIQDVTIGVDDAVQGVLNPLAINAIRPLAGRGIRIYGARTMSSDPDWIFVNVRRLMMMIEKAIDVATQWAIFEPNDVLTRSKLSLVLTSFLLSLWERGALMGAVADEAFFVRCDEGNNPPDDRAQGRMLAEVGVAPVRPFEFIILRVGRAQNQFEITEESSLAMGSGVF